MTPPRDLRALDRQVAEHVVASSRPLCQCGCGTPLKRTSRTNRSRGQVKGDYFKFAMGHYSRTAEFRAIMASVNPLLTVKRGESNGNWKGGSQHSQGYWRIGERFEHRIVAERMLGRKLRPGEVVHHKNGNRKDNRPQNLEIYPNHSEHMKVHMSTEEARRRGLKAKRKRCCAALAAIAADKAGASP